MSFEYIQVWGDPNKLSEYMEEKFPGVEYKVSMHIGKFYRNGKLYSCITDVVNAKLWDRFLGE